MLKVTQTQIFPTKNAESKTKAFASITLGDETGDMIAIRNIRVVSGEKGLFVAMPSEQYEKDGEKKFRDVAFPVNSDARKVIEDAILDAFNAQV
jgi:stage V sporulation protein G